MKLLNIYFSPTGNTQVVANTLADIWEDKTQIDLSKKDTDYGQIEINKEDIAIISVPSFGGRVPIVALNHIHKLKGKGAKAIIVAVYGNRAYEDTLIELFENVEKAGFSIIAAISAVAEHSIMRQYAQNRPDQEDKESLKTYAHKIKKALEEGKEFYSLTLQGQKPYKEYKGVPFKPKAGKTCTKCKICAKNCPVGAISEEKPNRTDEKKCISCMRCIKICPVKARKLNKLMLSVASKKMEKLFEQRKTNEIFMAIKED